MKSRKIAAAAALFCTLLVSLSSLAQTRERADIALEHTWNLADIYPSDEAWAADRDDLAGRFDEVVGFRDTLADSPQTLLACLTLRDSISKQLGRLYSYASMRSDVDTRQSEYQGLKQSLRQLTTDYASRTAFLVPEIAAIEQQTVDDFLGREPGLAVYKMYLHDIQRTKEHLLSAEEEKIVAEAGLLAAAPSAIFSIFSNAEMPFPEITLSDGTTAKLNQAAYARLRASENRDDRKAVFDAFFGAFDQFKQTFGTQLSSQVNVDMFRARVRNYNSSLEKALDGGNIPVSVYHSLIGAVHGNLDSFHRYLRLKQRMLDVEQLEYYDVYAPVVAEVDLSYSYEQAQRLVLESLAPMGQDYVRVVEESFRRRWIDVYPSEGKRVGAYCNGSCYDVHPYMLLNYNGQYNDVSTLTHEMGHAMHSYYSNKTQPFATADYAIFVAEVASTLNEALLINKMLDTIKDDDVRLSLLMNYLDGIKGTVFRQTQFAEFELAIHQKAESGQPLTGDVLTEIYGNIIRKYYGHNEGVCNVDDAYCVEWAYVPHFYYNFYVYQYATSFTASTALSRAILAGEPGAVERTIEFLSAGGSDYPVDILKRAGVDMTSPEPFDRTMVAMNRVMDQIEEILDRR